MSLSCNPNPTPSPSISSLSVFIYYSLLAPRFREFFPLYRYSFFILFSFSFAPYISLNSTIPEIYGNRDQGAWRTKFQRSDVSNILICISHNSMECIILKKLEWVLNPWSLDYQTSVLPITPQPHYSNLMFFLVFILLVVRCLRNV